MTGMPWLYTSCRVLQPPANLYFRITRHGSDVVPRCGPVIFAPNHVSYLDPCLLAFAFPKRTIRFLMTARWFDRSRLWRFLFEGWGAFPTRRRPADTIRAAVDHLERGRAVCVFPEGGIRRDGRIGRGRSGIARIAAASGAPVIPVGIRGSARRLPVGRRFPTPGRVDVHVGEPRTLVVPSGTVPSKERLRAFVDDVMAALRRLTAERDASTPGDAVATPSRASTGEARHP